MRSVGCDALFFGFFFFWGKDHSFLLFKQRCCSLEGVQNRICKAPSLAVWWSYPQKTSETSQGSWEAVVAARRGMPLALSWTCSGAVTDGPDKLPSQPKANAATAAGRCFQLAQEAEGVLVWHICEIRSKMWGRTFVSIKPEMICVELNISSPVVDASPCPWPWRQEIAHFVAHSKATETSL